jgi:hypothetical protein
MRRKDSSRVEFREIYLHDPIEAIMISLSFKTCPLRAENPPGKQAHFHYD